MADESRILWSDTGAAMLQHENLTVLVIRETITLERMAQMQRTTADIFARFGTTRARLTIVEAPAVVDVPKEVRDAAAALLREFPTSTTATVIEGSGFRAIAGRSIMAGLTLLSGQRASSRIFADATQAAQWIAPRIPRADGVRELFASDVVGSIARARGARGNVASLPRAASAR